MTSNHQPDQSPVPDAPAAQAMIAMLQSARVVAVIGASQSVDKPAHYVPAYMRQNGYRVIPVNPGRVGDILWDEPVRATLAEIDEPVDIVDVFRPGPAVAEHLDDILAMRVRPKVVWLQLGIRNDEVARTLRAAGIEVVQDRCLLVEHRDLVGKPVAPSP